MWIQSHSHLVLIGNPLSQSHRDHHSVRNVRKRHHPQLIKCHHDLPPNMGSAAQRKREKGSREERREDHYLLSLALSSQALIQLRWAAFMNNNKTDVLNSETSFYYLMARWPIVVKMKWWVFNTVHAWRQTRGLKVNCNKPKINEGFNRFEGKSQHLEIRRTEREDVCENWQKKATDFF